MRRLVFLILLISVLTFGPDPGLQAGDWASRVHEFRLSNGMKFLIYPRGTAPVFSAYVRFKAGGMDERPGQSGLAHFLEHMAFKGTESIGTKDFEKEKPILEEIRKTGQLLSDEYGRKGGACPESIRTLKERLKVLRQQEEPLLVREEVSKRMEEAGGTDQNATTSKDMTSYFVNLPADQLEFWAGFESERIFKPVFREFYEEKDVVMEERRMRVENDPDGRMYEALLEAAFPGKPYGLPTIGYEKDLLRLTPDDLQDFWKRLYHPERAIGVLVGQLDPDKTRDLLEKTFGHLTWSDPVEPEEARPAFQPGFREIRKTIRFPAKPRLLIGYHKPSIPDRDDYAFDLLDQILGNGRSSRLYRRLVLEQHLASSLSTYAGEPGSRGDNLFIIQAVPAEGHTVEEVLKAIDTELGGLREKGVEPQERERATNRLASDFVWPLKTNEGLASQLSYFEIIAGSWRYLTSYLETIRGIDEEFLKNVAQKYLVSSNRVVIELQP